VFRITFEKYRCFGSIEKFVDERYILIDKLCANRDYNI